MSRIPHCFAALRERNEKALVTFVTAGDPFPDRTAEVLLALAAAGADIIELGIPFSDPLADGPTIQASSQRALDTGMTPPKVLEIVRRFRQQNTVTPIVLMGAWNPVLQYGLERFVRDAADCGVDGTIMTDLTPEEAGAWKGVCDPMALDTIFLVAPTSTSARLRRVGELCTGFVYCVSRTGVTGARNDIPAELPPLLDAIRARSSHPLPVCVGFGIATPAHVAAICRFADGAVVGSALVDLLHRERENLDGLGAARDYVAALKSATRADFYVKAI